MSLPADIAKKVKLLELSTRKLVNNLFAGEYHTAFKGQGMTFSEFREYVPGDDVRTIAWSLTARTGKTFIKKFDEERELTLILAVDISGSADYGSGHYFKGEVMTHLSALLSFSAARNKDHVGLLLFSDQVEHFVPPKKGHGHVNRLLRDLYYFKPKSRKTKLQIALNHLQGVLKKRATIFIFSDFMDSGFDSGLRLLGRKHDVIAVVVQDQAEMTLPDVGLLEVQDAETGEMMVIDTSSPAVRREYEAATKKAKEERDRLLRLSQVDRIDVISGANSVTSDNDFVDPLVKFFRSRRSR
ncbi:MAG: DUF58 domain-containing protein [Pseudobdellovibrionaceae bacterium]